MIRPLAVSALLVATLLAMPAAAVETPRPGPADPRIKTVDYDPQQVVRIVGVFRTATQIRFAADETILHVALGDTSGWEVAPETSILFAKPVAARALYEASLGALRTAGVGRVEAGEFAADMQVELVNDGPVTILLDSRKGF